MKKLYPVNAGSFFSLRIDTHTVAKTAIRPLKRPPISAAIYPYPQSFAVSSVHITKIRKQLAPSLPIYSSLSSYFLRCIEAAAPAQK